MRPILPDDLDAAVRVVLAAPSGRELSSARLLLVRAHAADRYRKRFLRQHPLWGGGRVAAATISFARAGRPRCCDRAYCGALAIVLQALGEWRGGTGSTSLKARRP